MNLQIVSIVGAGLILAAYGANLRSWLGPSDRLYSLMNLVGASLLTCVAAGDQRIGFIVLEGVWALVWIPPLLRPPPRRSAS